MRKLIAALIVLAGAAVLGGCHHSLTYEEAMAKLNGGGYALIYAGSFEVDTNSFTGSRKIAPGTLRLSTFSTNVSYGERTREIDSAGSLAMWGGTLVPAGDWALYEIVYAKMQSLTSFTSYERSFGFSGTQPQVHVNPGEVVYIGQFEAAAPSLSAIFSEQKVIRRDNFNKFRDELRLTDPAMAARVVYRPVQGSSIAEAR